MRKDHSKQREVGKVDKHEKIRMVREKERR
jgi:hypothetical protein